MEEEEEREERDLDSPSSFKTDVAGSIFVKAYLAGRAVLRAVRPCAHLETVSITA